MRCLTKNAAALIMLTGYDLILSKELRMRSVTTITAVMITTSAIFASTSSAALASTASFDVSTRDTIHPQIMKASQDTDKYEMNRIQKGDLDTHEDIQHIDIITALILFITFISISVSAWNGWIANKINSRFIELEENRLRDEARKRRKKDLEKFTENLFVYRQIIMNTAPVMLDINSDYNSKHEVVIHFDDHEGISTGEREFAYRNFAFVREKDNYNNLLAFSFRGEFEFEKMSIDIHDNFGIGIDSEKWDKLFDAMRKAFEQTLRISPRNRAEDYSKMDSDRIYEIRTKKIGKNKYRGPIPMKSKIDSRMKRAIELTNDVEVKRFLDKISHIDARDERGRTFLHIACKYGHEAAQYEFRRSPVEETKPYVARIISRQQKIIKMLVDAGSDPNARDDMGLRPIHQAANENDIYSIMTLVANGAEVNAGTELDGTTALHIICGKWPCRYNDIKRMLDKGADVNALDSSGETPLHKVLLQAKNGNVSYYYIVDGKKIPNKRLPEINLLIECGANIHHKNATGKSCYDIILEYDDAEIMALVPTAD